MNLKRFLKRAEDLPDSDRMPVLFVGHGSPMNGVEDNAYARAWIELGRTLPKPRAILCVSAHWLTRGAYVHVGERPKTIHDFWGFPQELYELRYPCPGAPETARETRSVVTAVDVQEDTIWGVDHGCWIVMRRMYPEADIPVCQLSIDATKPSRVHFEIGKELAALRDKGVLIVGSGNLVHNLGMVSFENDTKPFDWAVEHDANVKDLVLRKDYGALIAHEKLGRAAAMSIPTPDHWWPLFYVLGAAGADERISFPVEGITHASVSMRAILIEN